MVNGKKIGGRRRYQMIDNIMINGLYADMKRNAEKRVGYSGECFVCSERPTFVQKTMIVILVSSNCYQFNNKI